MKKRVKFNLLLLLSIFTSLSFRAQTSEKNMKTVYIGTYTRDEGFVNGRGKGIYYMLQNPEDGHLELGKVVAKVVNPSYVKVSNNGKYLFSVSELVSGEANSGGIFSFKINPDKTLTKINNLPTNGFAPCHIAIDKTGRYLFVANYLGGVVMVYTIADSGELASLQKLKFENPNKSHTHSVNISPDNRHVYINDLGNDKIWIYKMDASKEGLELKLQGNANFKKGSGPRHFSFSKNSNYGYSVNELNSTVTVFEIKKDGMLSEIQSISTLPKDFQGKNSGAEIHIGNQGNFLYASNRGDNSIVTYKIDKKSGKLEVLEFTSTKGATPRNFTISPDGNYMYAGNQDSSNILVFKIEKSSGKLTKIQDIEAPTPVCIEFMN